MDVGLKLPSGCDDEFAGWEPQRAWDQMVGLDHQAEVLGFESIWLLDHLQTMPEPIDAPVFESFVALTAFASATSREARTYGDLRRIPEPSTDRQNGLNS